MGRFIIIVRIFLCILFYVVKVFTFMLSYRMDLRDPVKTAASNSVFANLHNI
jgi:hypothetical protein